MKGNKFTKEIKQLESIKQNKGKAAAVFSLKDKVIGKKKTPQEQVVIVDPETGNEVCSPEDIKRVSLNFVVDLLKTKEPKEKYAAMVTERKDLHYKRMEEKIPNDLEELPEESFHKVLESLMKKPGNKYEFITKSGSSLKFALLNLFKIIWRTERLPASWQESEVTQLWKGKGKTSELSSWHNIHDRNIMGKFFGQNSQSHQHQCSK